MRKMQDMDEDDWRTKLKLRNDPSPYRVKFLNLVLELQHMLDRIFGRIKVSKQRVEINSAGERSICSAPCRAIPPALEFEKPGIDNMLAMDVIEPVRQEWAKPILFAPKKYFTLWFCVDYCQLNIVAVLDSHPIPDIRNSWIPLMMPRFSRHWTQITATAK